MTKTKVTNLPTYKLGSQDAIVTYFNFRMDAAHLEETTKFNDYENLKYQAININVSKQTKCSIVT